MYFLQQFVKVEFSRPLCLPGLRNESRTQPKQNPLCCCGIELIESLLALTLFLHLCHCGLEIIFVPIPSGPENEILHTKNSSLNKHYTACPCLQIDFLRLGLNFDFTMFMTSLSMFTTWFSIFKPGFSRFESWFLKIFSLVFLCLSLALV